MDAVKPPKNVSGLVHTFNKVLRLRASGGVAPIDGIKKIKNPHNAAIDESPAKLGLSHQEEEERRKKEKEKEKQRKREAMEVLLAMLFASVSAVKAAYAQMQIAQCPYDPDCIQSSDEVIVSELKTLSHLKLCHLKKPILPSRDSQLSAEFREQQNLLRTYEIMAKKLHSQLQLQDSEMLFLREKLLDLSAQSSDLERRLNPGSFPSAVDNLHFSGLNPTHFNIVHKEAVRSIRSFVQLMIDEMVSAGWDINAAAGSIQPSASFAPPSHRCLAFESYVCRKLFAGFGEPNFSGSDEGERRRHWHYFQSFMDLKARRATEILRERARSEFAMFCRIKYLSVVHPKMESSFFGDLGQRRLLSSGGLPETPFFSAFAEMAKRVWLLHCLGSSFEHGEAASAFQVESGSRFSEVYMEAAEECACRTPEKRWRVAFTVVPGFRVRSTVVKSTVYVSPA